MKRNRVRDSGSWRLALWVALALLLLLPLAAMQFTSEVNWTTFDFMVAGALLVGAGAAYELVAHFTIDTRLRAMLGAIIVLIVALVWAHGAVGIY